MAILTVRNDSAEAHKARGVRAALHSHSVETEVRGLLDSVVSPQERVKLGSLLADMGRRAKLTDEEFADFGQVRSKTPPAR